MTDLEKRLVEAKRIFESWPKSKQDAMRAFVEAPRQPQAFLRSLPT